MPQRRPGESPARRTAHRTRPSAATASEPDAPDTAQDVGWLPGQPRYLTDPAIAEHIAAFVASAPAMTDDQCRKLARLLRTNRCTIDRPEPPTPHKSIPRQRRTGDEQREQAA